MFGLDKIFGRSVPRIDPATATRLIEQGAFVLDVRGPSEFASGAAPDAVNVPLGELAQRSSELPRDRPIVAYCRSGMRSAKAVRQLVEAGFDAHDAGGLGNLMR
ncbi:MAG: rhodanese-like domain-containing protein [Myxococcota bacterium]